MSKGFCSVFIWPNTVILRSWLCKPHKNKGIQFVFQPPGQNSVWSYDAWWHARHPVFPENETPLQRPHVHKTPILPMSLWVPKMCSVEIMVHWVWAPVRANGNQYTEPPRIIKFINFDLNFPTQAKVTNTHTYTVTSEKTKTSNHQAPLPKQHKQNKKESAEGSKTPNHC